MNKKNGLRTSRAMILNVLTVKFTHCISCIYCNFSCILVRKIVLGQIKYSYNYESKSSFFFFKFLCVSV